MDKKKTLQEVLEEWEEHLMHRSSGDDCAICEHSKKCFFAARGYDDWPECPWQSA